MYYLGLKKTYFELFYADSAPRGLQGEYVSSHILTPTPEKE